MITLFLKDPDGRGRTHCNPSNLSLLQDACFEINKNNSFFISKVSIYYKNIYQEVWQKSIFNI